MTALLCDLQSERVGHQQTGRLLEQEREKARLAEAELAILRRQLTREKTTFENAYVHVQVYLCGGILIFHVAVLDS